MSYKKCRFATFTRLKIANLLAHAPSIITFLLYKGVGVGGGVTSIGSVVTTATAGQSFESFQQFDC